VWTRNEAKKPPPAHFFDGLKLRLVSEPKELASLKQALGFSPQPAYSNPKNEMAGVGKR